MNDQKRRITPEDLKHLKFLSQLAVSPDGTHVAYVRADVDMANNTTLRNIWLAPLDGGEPVQLTRSGKDSNPVWSPDGRTLAFVSNRSGKSQIYVMPLHFPGGEPRALTSVANGATAPVFSPDGGQIAFLCPMNAEERRAEDTPPAEGESDAPKSNGKSDTPDEKRFDPRVARRIPYRVGTNYVSDRFQQIYVIAADASPDDKPRRLTDLDEDYQQPRWSADGKALYTSRAQDPAADEPWRQGALYRIDAETGAETYMGLEGFACFAPLPSPDGRWLAFVRSPQELLSMSLNRLAVIDLHSGDVRDLSITLDRGVSQMAWAGDRLIFSVQNNGRCWIYSADLTTGELTPVVNAEFKAEQFDANQSGRIAFVASSAAHPQELFVARPEGDWHILTQLHADFLKDVDVVPFHHFTFSAEGGPEIDGWYLLPPDHVEGQQHPLLVDIHGGPHVMWGPHDENMWLEFQSYAAMGYTVFFCNPRGSGGYGEDFQKVLRGQWGPIAMADIMAGVDALIARGVVDESRLFVTGGSYGGYMTAWIVGHTDRFKAAVAVRGVYNLLSFFATSDIPSFVRDELGYLPLENPEFLWEVSPLAYAHRVTTPTLVIHSENDFRVPISEGEQLFGYLRRAGVETEFVRYPREGHELTRAGEPEHRIDHMRRVVAWFDKYR